MTAQGAQRIDDDRHIDAFLHQRTGVRRQPSSAVISFRAALRKGFERLPTGKHQGDDNARQRRAAGQGNAHGEGGNDIEAEVAASQINDDGRGQDRGNWDDLL